MAAIFKVTGLKETIRALERLERKVKGQITRRALRAGAKVIKAAVEAEAPKGETLELSANVKVRAGRRRKDYISVTVGIGAKDFVGDQYYAPMLEYGTSKMEGRHFMLHAAERVDDQARKVVIQELKNGVANL